MLKQTLTMCAIFFCTQLVAQTWYPGRYVNDEGDTISGFIEIKETDRNPTSINYKTTAEAESITTLPMDKVKFFAYSFGEHTRDLICLLVWIQMIRSLRQESCTDLNLRLSS